MWYKIITSPKLVWFLSSYPEHSSSISYLLYAVSGTNNNKCTFILHKMWITVDLYLLKGQYWEHLTERGISTGNQNLGNYKCIIREVGTQSNLAFFPTVPYHGSTSLLSGFLFEADFILNIVLVHPKTSVAVCSFSPT